MHKVWALLLKEHIFILKTALWLQISKAKIWYRRTEHAGPITKFSSASWPPTGVLFRVTTSIYPRSVHSPLSLLGIFLLSFQIYFPTLNIPCLLSMLRPSSAGFFVGCRFRFFLKGFLYFLSACPRVPLSLLLIPFWLHFFWRSPLESASRRSDGMFWGRWVVILKISQGLEDGIYVLSNLESCLMQS